MILPQTIRKRGHVFHVGTYVTKGGNCNYIFREEGGMNVAVGSVEENDDPECFYSVHSFIGMGARCLPSLDAVVEHFARQCDELAAAVEAGRARP